jgi:DNA-binding response OmpR family regulator
VDARLGRGVARLVLVDDDANLRRTLGYTLRQEGLEVFAAEDGERGSKPSGSAVRMSSCWT